MKGTTFAIGQDVLLDDMEHEQSSKKDGLIERFLDMKSYGICSVPGLTEFAISPDGMSDWLFSILKNTNAYVDSGERVIIEANSIYNEDNPTYTVDGICFSASTGNTGIPLSDYTLNTDNYVYIQSLDAKDSSVSRARPNSDVIHAVRGIDGYNVIVSTEKGALNGISNSVYIGSITAQGIQTSIAGKINQNRKKRDLLYKDSAIVWRPKLRHTFTGEAAVNSLVCLGRWGKNQGTLLAAAGSNFIQYSKDWGNSWSNSDGVASANSKILNIGNGEAIFGAEQKIYKSTDQGVTWALKDSPTNYLARSFVKLDHGIILAGMDYYSAPPDAVGKIIRSADRGETWSNAGATIDINSPTGFIDLGNGNVLVHGTIRTSGGVYNIYKSTNYGATWSGVTTVTSSNSTNCGAYDRISNTIIVAGSAADLIYRSLDGGNNWSLGYYTTDDIKATDAKYLGEGVFVVAGYINSTGPSVLIASFDYGRTWRRMWNCPTTLTKDTYIDYSPTTGVLYVLLQDYGGSSTPHLYTTTRIGDIF